MTSPESANTTPGVETRIVRLGQFRMHDPAAGFLIASARIDGELAQFGVKGEILDPIQGERYEMIGRVELSDRYGETFVFTSARLLLPNTMAGVQKFLARTLDFVGLAVAQRITDAYGPDSLRVLQHEPDRVATEISGITPERAQKISEWLKKHEAETALRVELESMLGAIPNMPRKTIEHAIERWGADAPAVIKNDPYQLIELPRIGFKLADEIAVQRFGYERSGRSRRKAAVLYALQQAAAQDGHTLMPDRDLIRTVVNLIGYEPGDDALRELTESNEIVAHKGDVQLAALAEAEATIAERIAQLNSFPLAETERFGSAPHVIASDPNAADQLAAWSVIDSARVTMLTGAPGTGKTWLVAKIVEAAANAGWVVQKLAAPTGKAAKRMTESMAAANVQCQPATTIYRMLGATIHEKTGEWDYTYTRKNSIASRTLFVLDEWSMVSTELAARVFDAANDNSRILIVGDPRQLPSIGAGAVLRDMIESGAIPHAELTQIKRNRGDLVRGIHAVKRGEVPTFSERLDLSDDKAPKNFRFIETPESEIAPTILGLLRKMQERGFDPVWDVQVMSPLNEKGPLCCDALNTLLADALSGSEMPIKGLEFRTGDKVVNTKNRRVRGHYENPDEADPNNEAGEISVVNGDLGRVIEITDRTVTVEHWTPTRTAVYPRRELTLRPAYCLTVHKMQGSSAPVCIIPIHKSFAGPIWTREWIYTAISRAEKACILVGESDVFIQAIRRPQHGKRRTRLTELLRPPAVAEAPAAAETKAKTSESASGKGLADDAYVDADVDAVADLNAALNLAAASEPTIDWFESNVAELPLNKEGRSETLPDGRRVWLHPNEIYRKDR